MPDRFWVGGTGTWDGTAGTKWSATSGGSGGASIPTTADDVYFNANSNTASAITVTIATGNTGARSINCTGFTRTIVGSVPITVAGSITLSSAMTFTFTDVVTITGTGTLTTAGKTFGGLTVEGTGITVTLNDALTTNASRDITVTRGTFNTGNFNVTTRALLSNNTNTRTITLGSSTLTLSGITSVDFTTTLGLTFNAGTSQINLSAATASLIGGSQTFRNVSFTSTNVGIRQITGTNTFNNLTLNCQTTGLSELSIAANQTVNGTFTAQTFSPVERGFVRSSVLHTARTITANAISATDCDFRDITLAGAAAGASPTRAGNCGNNSGINFPASKTVYRVGSNTTWGGSSSWASVSNGTGNNTNFPLPQDTAVLDNSMSASTITIAGYNISGIDASTRTSALTLNHSSSSAFYGMYHPGGTGITISGTTEQTFTGGFTQTITCLGKTITFPIVINKIIESSFTLASAFTSSNYIIFSQGTVNAATFNFTAERFTSNNSNVRTLTMGSGLWTLTGVGTGAGSPWSLQTTSMTVNTGSADILLSNNSTSARQFGGGAGVTYNRLTIGGNTGTSNTTISSGPTFNELASTKTVAHTISAQNPLNVNNWLVAGSAGNLVTVAGFTLNLTNVTNNIDYLAVQSLTVSNPNRFYVGANSVNNGNNTNVIFTATPTGGQSTSNMLLLF